MSSEAAPLEVYKTFLFADLSGFTALTEVHGDIDAVKIISRFTEITREVLPAGCHLVKSIGDEVMIVSDSVEDGIDIALRLKERVGAEPLFPSLRMGLHTGQAIEQGKDYFGHAVNLSARVAAYARSGQILCTEKTFSLSKSIQGVQFVSAGLAHFKNIVKPLEVYEVIRRSETVDASCIDPVCRMRVRADAVAAVLTVQEKSYSFCSFDCLKRFAEQPEKYLSLNR